MQCEHTITTLNSVKIHPRSKEAYTFDNGFPVHKVTFLLIQ